jgi:micrococcal nuclease
MKNKLGIFFFFSIAVAIITILIVSYSNYGFVSRVIDGDTIVLMDGRHIRYIGMDTPEKGDCYAQEATDYNRLLVGGEIVKLVRDKENKDQYGRLLRYVYVGDIFVNKRLVETGYAETFEIWPNTKYADEFKGAEDRAKEGRIGIWEHCEAFN